MPSKSRFEFSSQQNAHLPYNLCRSFGRVISCACWARGSDSHVLYTSLLIYTPHAPWLRCNKERYYFNSPICAQAGITSILSRNFRRKLPSFERKSGYQMPVYNTGLCPKKENIRIFHESWIFLPFININTLFPMYVFVLNYWIKNSYIIHSYSVIFVMKNENEICMISVIGFKLELNWSYNRWNVKWSNIFRLHFSLWLFSFHLLNH